MSNERKIDLGRKDVYARLRLSEYNLPELKGEGMLHLFTDNATFTVQRVTPEQLMEIATGAATVAAKMDPDNFDALWDKFKDSVREARGPAMTAEDWDKAFARPVPAGMTMEEYLDGYIPTMPEDTTADVCNAREADYLNNK